MKPMILLLTSLYSIAAFAHPFAEFEGVYQVTSPVSVINENASSCNRWVILNTTQITISPSSNPAETLVTFKTKLNGSDLTLSNLMGTFNYSNQNPAYSTSLSTAIHKVESHYLFTLDESYSSATQKSSCHYQVELKKL